MRLLLTLAVLPLLLGAAAGCLNGPVRGGRISATCPSWTEGLGSPSVTTVMNPNNPSSWQAIDFDAGNATRAPVPLTTGDTEVVQGKTLTQDRIALDFNWEQRSDGSVTRRGVFVQGGDLSVSFTHAAGGSPTNGRALPFYMIGLADGYDAQNKLKVFDHFDFHDRFAANFTLHVLLDNPDGSPAPQGAFAHWIFTPSGAQSLPPSYVYRATGLYDMCE